MMCLYTLKISRASCERWYLWKVSRRTQEETLEERLPKRTQEKTPKEPPLQVYSQRENKEARPLFSNSPYHHQMSNIGNLLHYHESCLVNNLDIPIALRKEKPKNVCVPIQFKILCPIIVCPLHLGHLCHKCLLKTYPTRCCVPPSLSKSLLNTLHMPPPSPPSPRNCHQGLS